MNSFARKAAIAAATGLLATGTAGADDTGYWFGEGNVVRHAERFASDREATYGFRLGLGFPVLESDASRTSLEVGVFSNPIEFNNRADVRQTGLMVDAVHLFKLGSVNPYVAAGVGAVQEFKSTPLAAEVGAGVLIDAFETVDLKLGASAQLITNDNVRPDKDQFFDLRAILGIQVPFGAAPAPVRAAAVSDTDGDGVPDSSDSCPSQAAPTADGCPAPLVAAEPERDTDADGVPDSQDRCSDTLSGLQVDGSGCVTNTAQKIVLKGVNFLSGSAELTADAKKVLDDAAEALAGQANLKVELGGYTDSLGDDALNASLSQRRADSVKKYLTGKGIAADRLSAKGYGEAQPIADNKTKAGRQENRRVELKVLN